MHKCKSRLNLFTICLHETSNRHNSLIWISFQVFSRDDDLQVSIRVEVSRDLSLSYLIFNQIERQLRKRETSTDAGALLVLISYLNNFVWMRIWYWHVWWMMKGKRRSLSPFCFCEIDVTCREQQKMFCRYWISIDKNVKDKELLQKKKQVYWDDTLTILKV